MIPIGKIDPFGLSESAPGSVNLNPEALKLYLEILEEVYDVPLSLNPRDYKDAC